MIYTYDELATSCLDRLDDLSSPSPRAKTRSDAKEADGSSGPEREQPPDDLYELLRARAPEDEKLQQLWRQVSTVPDWVDWAQIERGQKVFYRYAGPCIIGLLFQSLLGGMASARVVETLARTGGFGERAARRRLLDTFQHVLDVTGGVESVRPPGGRGFASSVRVRLLHAAVRRRILGLARARPGYYDVGALGVPINDLDCLATVLAFSAALVWLALPRQGIHPGAGEIADYLALWRYVAHLLGAPTAPLRSPTAARALMESLLASEIQPSATSRTLARSMLTALSSSSSCSPPPLLPVGPSIGMLHAEAHWLNGRGLADALGVPRPPWRCTALVAAQCAWLAALCYARRAVAAWDEAGVRRLRARLARATLERVGGRPAAHRFRYVPGLCGPQVPDGGGADGPGEDEDEEGPRDREGGMHTGGVGLPPRNLLGAVIIGLLVLWVACIA